EGGELRGERLGGGDADPRSRMRVEHVVALARDGGADHVADGEPAGPARLRLAEATEGVGRLAALRDGDAQRLSVDQRVPVAELARQVDLDRDAGQRLDHQLAGERGVPARAARDDVDLAQRLDRRRIELAPVEVDVAFFHRAPAA